MKVLKASVIFLLGIGMLNAYPGAERRVAGIIKDIDRQPVAGVKVVLLPSLRTARSSEDGSFAIPLPADLPAGEGMLQFSKEGYYRNSVTLEKFLKRRDRVVFMVPTEYLTEEISVSALNREEKKTTVPIAESSVSRLEIKEKLAANLVETVDHTPGVHFIGSGGNKATPSIRGFGRKRVLMLLDGARITSDRRAGTSASFIPPELISRVEVVRSASSVLYGSDAISGIINAQTGDRMESGGTLSLNADSNSRRVGGSFTYGRQLGRFSFSTGGYYGQAGNYRSPRGEVYHSGFQNAAGLLELNYRHGGRELSFSYFGARGTDIGKPGRENRERVYDQYPREENHFLRLNYSDHRLLKNTRWETLVYLNPSRVDLDKRNEPEAKTESSHTESVNLGFKSLIHKSAGKHLALQLGLDFFGRTGLSIDNVTVTDGLKERVVPLDDGRRSDLGLFVTADYDGIPGLDIFGGVRYTFLGMKALSDGEPRKKSDQAPSAFLAVSQKLGRHFSAFFNLGKAFRLPSLSESFYTGITGRRYVIGNERLEPESSFNLDAGIRFYSPHAFLGLYGFSYQVRDMIERYRVDGGIYTYGNVDRGQVNGVEMEFQFFPVQSLEIFGHGIVYQGRSRETDDPLNDVPSPKILLAAKYILNRFWLEANFLYSFPKEDPGPAEVANDAYRRLDFKGGVYLSSRLFFYAKIQNLLNEAYYANPDPDIPLAPGFALSAGCQYNIF